MLGIEKACRTLFIRIETGVGCGGSNTFCSRRLFMVTKVHTLTVCTLGQCIPLSYSPYVQFASIHKVHMLLPRFEPFCRRSNYPKVKLKFYLLLPKKFPWITTCHIELIPEQNLILLRRQFTRRQFQRKSRFIHDRATIS